MIIPETQLKGGKVNYYLVEITHPQREEQKPYQAECEDIIEALKLTPNEANIFKAIWRSAAARLGNGKPDHKAQYDAEKIVHYANRNLRALIIDAEKSNQQAVSFTARAVERIREIRAGLVHTPNVLDVPMTMSSVVNEMMENNTK